MQCPERDQPTGDSDVSIECLRSSEFVVGKQTNFNGAVTIINCADAGGEGGSGRRQERIVIRDKVLTPTAPTQGVPDRTGKLAGIKQKLDKWRESEHKKMAALVVSAFICIALLAAAVAGAVLLYPSGPTGDAGKPGTEGDPIYSKEDWGGRAAKSVVKMKLPVPYVVVSHTVTPRCHSLDTCAPLIRNMQAYHLSIDYADIAYNFLVDSSGNIYEGRGWDRRNVKGGFVNGRNIDIALVGDYSDDAEPTEELMDGLRNLLHLGLATQKISPDYSLIPSNTTYATLSPGKNVYNVIKAWPHFDADPTAHIKDFED